jgi:hypothetical protein
MRFKEHLAREAAKKTEVKGTLVTELPKKGKNLLDSYPAAMKKAEMKSGE